MSDLARAGVRLSEQSPADTGARSVRMIEVRVEPRRWPGVSDADPSCLDRGGGRCLGS